MRRLSAPLLSLLLAPLAFAQSCPPENGVALQILGSGGPIADDARASSAYLVWRDAKARVLVDVGGGALLRFAESGARFEDLDAVLLTHLHADHTADLPALLKSGYFSSRRRALLLAGPSAGGNARVHFPALDGYLNALLSKERGAYSYLSDYQEEEAGSNHLRPVVVGESGWQSHADNVGSELTIRAIPVSHGPVPAVAYRVDMSGHSMVFAGDQDGDSDRFSEFARSASVLLMHMPIAENAGSAARALHAPPSRLGEIARESRPQRLVLSHFMRRSLTNLDGNLAQVKRRFDGEIITASDLDCVIVPTQED